MNLLYREPVVYFLLIAVVFFIAFNFAGGSRLGDDKLIVVDRASLLRHWQMKTKAVDQNLLIRSFDAMPELKREKLITNFVREEALYREAQSLGLDKNDPVIKGRALQKLEFITQEYSEALLKVTDEQLEKYFDVHKKDYYIEPYVTFTHVFFSREFHGDEWIHQLAVEKLQELRKNNTTFSEAIEHGDRFPYHVNYVERTEDFVASHFGETLSKQVFDFSITKQIWRGPYASAYGSHLVLVSRLEEGRSPELINVVSQVYQDAKREQMRKSLEDTYQLIVDTYAVELSADLNSGKLERDQLVSFTQG